MQNEAYPDLFYIPKEEHPFKCALIGSGRLLCTLHWEDYEDFEYGYFLEVDITGKLKRTIVSWYYDEPGYVEAPAQGSDFPIYGLHAAGQLYVKYLPRMLAWTF